MVQIMSTMKKIKFIFLIFITFFLASCSIVPGMSEPKKSMDVANFDFVELNQKLVEESKMLLENYKISPGDTLSIIVFGQNDFFPVVSNLGDSPYSNRVVDEKGEIFFPYAGTLVAEGKTISDIRFELTERLESSFNSPQVDVAIKKYNSTRNIYVLGEVRRPITLSIGMVPLTLSDAIAEAQGLSQTTSNPKKVYVIRKNQTGPSGIVFNADLTRSSQFINAGDFNLLPGDIIFVGAADITKWNRFISQLFPFTSFLNQIDNFQN